MTSRSYMITPLLIASLYACAPGTEAPKAGVSSASLERRTAQCVTFREHAFTCRETIVDDWIAIRAKARPKLAKAMQTEAGRLEIRNVALKEFVADGSGPKAPRVERCKQVAQRTPESALPHVQRMLDCGQPQEAGGCQAWARCVLPAFEAMVTGR